MDETSAVFDHAVINHNSNKKFIKMHSYYDEMFTMFNRVIKDLTNPSVSVSKEVEAQDLEIITRIMARPTVSYRIFTDLTEAKKTLGNLYDLMLQNQAWDQVLPLEGITKQQNLLQKYENSFATMKNC